jgi:hypothetical protein
MTATHADSRSCVQIAQHNSGSRAAQAPKKGELDTSERTSAEDDSADGSRGLTIRNANVTAGLALVYGHLGDDGDAHTGAYHAEDAAELAALENNLGIEPGAIACSDGRVPEAVSIPEKKERFGAEILERKRTVASEFVVFGESGEKTLGEERKGFKLVPADG